MDHGDDSDNESIQDIDDGAVPEVQDLINAARNMGVSVGPGRGSVAGSIVAYSLGITKIDPIKSLKND